MITLEMLEAQMTRKELEYFIRDVDNLINAVNCRHGLNGETNLNQALEVVETDLEGVVIE